MSAPTYPTEAACFYILDGAYRGPVSEEELDALHADGTLRADAQVRTPGNPGWRTYKDWCSQRERPTPARQPVGPSAKSAKEPEADAGPRHTCVICRKEWPESLMLVNDRRWFCRSCFYGEAMKARREREKTRRDWWKLMREHWKSFSVTTLVLSTLAFLAWHYRHELPFDFFDEEEPIESWARQSPESWPQLVFTNWADFHHHSPLRGQSIFFARRPDGTAIAATAGHVITADAGVTPDMTPSELEGAMRVWWAYPPGAPDGAIALAGLYGSPAALRGYDILFLRAATDAKVGGVTPLRLARHNAHGGQKVFVVSPAAPTDPKSGAARQVVLLGKVHIKSGTDKGAEREGTILDIHVDPAFLPRNLGGAPVIDERGHLLGIVKGWGEPLDAAGHVDTVVAQGMATFRDLLEPKKEETNPIAAKMEKLEKSLLEK